MVPNQRADSSASLSLRPLRSLRLNGARFNSLEADPDGRDLGAVIEKNSRGLLSPEERGSPKAEGRRSKQIRTALGLGLRALDFGLWALDFGLWTLDFGLWTLDFGLWTLDFSATRMVARSGGVPACASGSRP